MIAAVLLTATSPVTLALAWMVRRQDGHAAFITVPRVGRAGQPFGMWKLRSMRVDDESGRAAGPALTSSNDDRITPVGARMRSLHLDELPQLVNVVRGEMCLLGPRPEAPEFVDDTDRWRSVLSVPPGIAGPTQLIVSEWERTEIDRDPHGDVYREVVVPVKLSIDAWYARSATPSLDLLVLTSLLRHVLPGGEGSRLRTRVRRWVPDATPAVEYLEREHRRR